MIGGNCWERQRPMLVGGLLLLLLLHGAAGNDDARRLFEDLLSDYNKLVRPEARSKNRSEPLNVKFKMRLSQLLDVHEKNQIVTTNVWLEHEWYDPKMSWDPARYGGVQVLYVPSEMIWLPDIVLYNNADGNYQVTIMTKATVNYTGRVSWNPPAIYKSMCPINVEWFPFDLQECSMKFGCWTYDGLYVDLSHKTTETQLAYTEHRQISDGIQTSNVQCVENGIDLADYYRSTEWDILAVPGWKRAQMYPCCPEPYIDITYKITLRRKTLFYTVNLILPCVGISFLTILVFYLPNDSGEKVTLSISILISLTVFFLLLVEIIPATSLVVPLIGKYLLFTMVMVTISICVSVVGQPPTMSKLKSLTEVVINVHYRGPHTHVMSPFVRYWFMEKIPTLLFMQRRVDSERFAQAQELDLAPVPTACSNGGGGCAGFAAARSNTNVRMAYSGSRSNIFRELRNPLTLDDVTSGERSLLLSDTTKVACDDLRSLYSSSVIYNNYDAHQPPNCQRPHTLDRAPNYGSIGHRSSKAVAANAKPTQQQQQQPACENCKSYKTQVKRTLTDVNYIAANMRYHYGKYVEMEDWKFVATVIDRCFLVLFTVTCIVGTVMIIFQAPTHYDRRLPIDLLEEDQMELHRRNGISYCRDTARAANSTVTELKYSRQAQQAVEAAAHRMAVDNYTLI